MPRRQAEQSIQKMHLRTPLPKGLDRASGPCKMPYRSCSCCSRKALGPTARQGSCLYLLKEPEEARWLSLSPRPGPDLPSMDRPWSSDPEDRAPSKGDTKEPAAGAGPFEESSPAAAPLLSSPDELGSALKSGTHSRNKSGTVLGASRGFIARTCSTTVISKLNQPWGS